MSVGQYIRLPPHLRSRFVFGLGKRTNEEPSYGQGTNFGRSLTYDGTSEGKEHHPAKFKAKIERMYMNTWIELKNRNSSSVEEPYHDIVERAIECNENYILETHELTRNGTGEDTEILEYFVRQDEAPMEVSMKPKMKMMKVEDWIY